MVSRLVRYGEAPEPPHLWQVRRRPTCKTTNPITLLKSLRDVFNNWTTQGDDPSRLKGCLKCWVHLSEAQCL